MRNQGIFGTVEFQQTKAIKKLRNQSQKKIFQNQIRILEVLRPLHQHWFPRHIEWNSATHEIKMQRFFYNHQDLKILFPKQRPSFEEKELFCQLIKQSFRDMKEMHKVLCHFDVHDDNIMIRKTQNGRLHLVFIDFGMSLLLRELQLFFSTFIIDLVKKSEERELFSFFQRHCQWRWQKECLHEIIPNPPRLTNTEDHIYDDIHDFCLELVKKGRFLPI